MGDNMELEKDVVTKVEADDKQGHKDIDRKHIIPVGTARGEATTSSTPTGDRPRVTGVAQGAGSRNCAIHEVECATSRSSEHVGLHRPALGGESADRADNGGHVEHEPRCHEEAGTEHHDRTLQMDLQRPERNGHGHRVEH